MFYILLNMISLAKIGVKISVLNLLLVLFLQPSYFWACDNHVVRGFTSTAPSPFFAISYRIKCSALPVYTLTVLNMICILISQMKNAAHEKNRLRCHKGGRRVLVVIAVVLPLCLQVIIITLPA